MNKTLLHALIVCTALLSIEVCGVSAQSISSPKMTDPLRSGTGETYASLVELVVPGLVEKDNEYFLNQEVDIKHIYWDEASHLRPMPIRSLNLTDVAVRSGGKDRLALLLDFGEQQDRAEGLSILALFDMSDKPKLLDAANIAFDRHTFFLDPARLPVDSGNDVLLTRSTHFNSNQHYAITALIFVRNDRFEFIDTVFTLGEKNCNFERTQQPSFRQDLMEPFARIIATVTELTIAAEEPCDATTMPMPRTRTISVTYKWNAITQRFIPDSDALRVLERENEERL